jgi:uncharacterized protein YbjT (DUF2867 family)
LTKIFVAGATGYIGKNVVKSALERNFKVVIATRQESTDFDLSDQNLNVIEISKSDNSWIENLQGIDVVIS